ncbi:hypothetical protein [Natrinema sp. H-ect4]|uniref:hypothetical protein n=1 Tax=Natrinema sp. H-ect4 TaxID=3242699 RepID=UPI0035A8FF9D
MEDFVYIVVSISFVVVAGGFVLAANPQFDAQYRFVLREGLDAFGDGEDADLTLAREDVQMVNSVSSTSYGPDPVGDERLFCMKVDDGVVTELRFVDNISESTKTSISGSCISDFSSTDFDGFLHTQPGYSDELSDEDKDLESPEMDYTCIAYDRIVKVRGEVGGVKCWEITGSEDSGFNFTEVEVAITSRPELLPS